MPQKTEIPVMSLIGILSEVNKGHIRIPDFQRDYIWTSEQVLDLLDSVWNGYPIGSVLLWKTTQSLKEHNPMKIELPPRIPNVEILYLLDGQQRIVTLYGVLNGSLELGKKKKSNYKVFFNLETKEFSIYTLSDLRTETEVNSGNAHIIPLEDVMEINYVTSSASQNNEIITKLATNPEYLKSYVDLFIRLTSLEIPAIINGQDLSIATKIFERLNNTGTPLSIVDLMVATTYTSSFNLRNSLSDLYSELYLKNFGIPERVLLQSIAGCLQKGITREHIINSSEIEVKWGLTKNSLNSAIDFLIKHCSVPTSKFLPNNVLVVPLAYFFYKGPERQLTIDTVKSLKKFFWFGVLSERYDQSQDTKIAEDISKMDELFNGNHEGLFDYHVHIDAEDILNTDMSFGSSFASTVMCFLASKKPLEFKNNEEINLGFTFGDENQKQAHHIFPVNFLKTEYSQTSKYKRKIEPYMNSVANISLISKVTNRNIWDRRPSNYFSEFKRYNPEISISLESHLINEDYGIYEDDFPNFINKRARRIADEMNAFVDSLKETVTTT